MSLKRYLLFVGGGRAFKDFKADFDDVETAQAEAQMYILGGGSAVVVVDTELRLERMYRKTKWRDWKPWEIAKYPIPDPDEIE